MRHRLSLALAAALTAVPLGGAFAQVGEVVLGESFRELDSGGRDGLRGRFSTDYAAARLTVR
jgi:hypothetical protein